MLTLKESNGVASVMSVQRVHDLFRGIKVQNPDKLRTRLKNKDDDKKDNNKEKGSGKIAVIELYKFPKKMKYVRTCVCVCVCVCECIYDISAIFYENGSNYE